MCWGGGCVFAAGVWVLGSRAGSAGPMNRTPCSRGFRQLCFPTCPSFTPMLPEFQPETMSLSFEKGPVESPECEE